MNNRSSSFLIIIIIIQVVYCYFETDIDLGYSKAKLLYFRVVPYKNNISLIFQ